VAEGNVAGELAVVTGGGGGIGREVALALAQAGARVVVACRCADAGAAVAAHIRGATGNDAVWAEAADLASAGGVASLAAAVARRAGAGGVKVLVNCAAAAPARAREATVEGLEVQLAVGVLGAHRLARALLPALRAAAPAQVLNIGSTFAGGLDLADLSFDRRPYSALRAYQASKQAVRMLTWGWAERAAPAGVAVNCCHPGVVMGTKVASALGLRAGTHTAREAGAGVARVVQWVAEGGRWHGATGAFWIVRSAAERAAASAVGTRTGAGQGDADGPEECPWQDDEGCAALLRALDELDELDA
jgi:NAD(P)-dependent dehydrogenase (short-subunit alcohol dehydrogenase family)